jgi:uncharacterized membrane protein YheB (UPF0754 family)
MSPELLKALTTIGFGALAGGLTNAVAVWMLFHPYEPPRLFGRRIGFLQGAVPKNQARLAAAIGRTVGGKLLTPGDLTRMFADREFRDAFDQRLAAFLDAALHRQRGSLREILPERTLTEVEALLERVVELGVDRLAAWAASPDFEELAVRKAADLVAAVADEPIGGILTPAREAALTGAIDEWLVSVTEGEDFRRTVEESLDRASRRFLQPGRTFEEILPTGLVTSLERAIAGYLPLAIARLSGLLEDPAARERFESTLQELMRRFLQDLRFHQRVVARLIVTEETVERVLDTIRDEGAARISEMLGEPEIQSAMARGVNDAVVDFLRRPVTSVLGEPDDTSVQEARATLTGGILRLAADPASRAFVVGKVDAALEKAGARTWGELFERIPPERLAGWLVQAARSEAASGFARSSGRALVAALLDRPIGRPSDWLPEEAPARIEAALADPIWEWLQTQVPEVVQRIDVGRRVEEKVIEFPTPKMEELVRKVTDRELRLIVRLGYILGAFVGMVLLGVNALLG